MLRIENLNQRNEKDKLSEYKGLLIANIIDMQKKKKNEKRKNNGSNKKNRRRENQAEVKRENMKERN